MEHYYSKEPTSKSDEKEIKYELNEKTFRFLVDNGVFSKERVDFASDLMLKALVTEEISGNVLDVGCGYGVFGIVLSSFFDINCKMIDINSRAIGLSEKNIKLNNCKKIKAVQSDSFENIKDDELFDVIVTNPPIRAGKKVIYDIYSQSYKHLKSGGCLYLVINNKHGAPSTKEFLTEMFGNCEILDKKAGFHVIKCVRERI
jgi:16S rRNA (guanine1207-N2)-methyltransferase